MRQDVDAHDIDRFGPRVSEEAIGMAYQAPHGPSSFKEARDQAAADVASGPSDQDPSFAGTGHAACLPIQKRRQSPPDARSARNAYRLAVKKPSTITKITHTMARARDASR